MKKIFLLLLLTLVLPTVFAGSGFLALPMYTPPIESPVDCPQGLVSYWKFNGNYDDTVGSNNALILEGANFADGGVEGAALSTDNANKKAHAKVLSDYTLALQEYTIVGWFKLHENSGKISGGTLFSRAAGKDLLYKMDFSYNAKGSTIKFYVNKLYAQGTGITGIEANKWYQFAASFDGDVMRVYFDGNLVGQKVLADKDKQKLVTSGYADLIIGNAETLNKQFMGSIDEFKIFNRVLETEEIETLARATSISNLCNLQIACNNGVIDGSDVCDDGNTNNGDGCYNCQVESGCQDNLALHLRLDGAPVDNLGQSSGLTFGLVSFDTDHAVGTQSAHFDISDKTSRIEIPHHVNHASQVFTVSTWFNPDDVNGNPSSGVLYEKSAGKNILFRADLKGSIKGSSLTFSIGKLKATGSGLTIAPNTWYHVVGSYDGNEIRIYFDGELVGQKLVTDKDKAKLDLSGYSTIILGNDGKKSKPWSGSLDDFMIFNDVLTSGKVYALYKHGDLGNNCVFSKSCGNGVIENSEACDDGNTANGDSCSSSCSISTSCQDGLALQLRLDGTPEDNLGQCDGSTAGIVDFGTDHAVGTQSVHFGAADKTSRVEIPHHVNHASQVFTVSTWFNPDDVNGNPSSGVLYEKSAGKNIIFRADLKGSIKGSSLTFSVGKLKAIGSGLTIAPNTWYHVVGSYDGNSIRLYFDGNLVAQKIVTAKDKEKLDLSGYSMIILGNDGKKSKSWSGSLDDFQVYNRGLLDNEVFALYRHGEIGNNCNFAAGCGNGVIENSEACDDGNTANGDSCSSSCSIANSCQAGLAVHLRLDGTPEDNLWQSNGLAAGLANFDSSDKAVGTHSAHFNITDKTSRIEIPHHVNHASQVFTVSTWFNADDFKGNPASGVLYEKSAGKNIIFRADLKGSIKGSSLTFSVGKLKATGSGLTIAPNTWYHVVGSYDGNSIRLYFDGNLVAQKIVTAKDKEKLDLSGYSTIILGNDGKKSKSWSGSLDDFQVYNRGLLDNEVFALYKHGDLGNNCNFDDTCGNGIIENSEACDDGNTASGDSCSSSCSISTSCQESLALHLRLDGTPEDNLGQNDGSTAGIVEFGTDHAVGTQSVHFDVSDKTSRIEIPHHVNHASQVFTVSTWFNADDVKSSPASGVLYEKSAGKNIIFRADLKGSSKGSSLTFSVGKLKATGSGLAIAPGAWYHVVGSYDGNSIRLYFDGNLVAQKIVTDKDKEKLDLSGISTIILGNDGKKSKSWSGKLDDFQVYNRPLLDNEVYDLYKKGDLGNNCNFDDSCGNGVIERDENCDDANSVSTDGCHNCDFDNNCNNKLESYWQFENNALDAKGFNDGFSSGIVNYNDGHVDQGVAFSGSVKNSAVLIPHSNSMDADHFTISMWFKPNRDLKKDTPLSGTLMDKIAGKNAHFKLYYTYNAKGSTIKFNVGKLYAQGTGILGLGEEENQFYHVAGSYDGSMIKVYYQGMLVGQKIVTDKDKAKLDLHGFSTTAIGNEAKLSKPYPGTIDEVQFFDTALSDNEVFALAHMTDHCAQSGQYCGDGEQNGEEECDGQDDFLCPGACQPDCTCFAVCGNDEKEGSEVCDGNDDSNCLGECREDCTCPVTPMTMNVAAVVYIPPESQYTKQDWDSSITWFKNKIEELSQFHGYNNPNSPKSVNVNIVDTKYHYRSSPFPEGYPTCGEPGFDKQDINRNHEALQMMIDESGWCNLINNGQINQIWVYTDISPYPSHPCGSVDQGGFMKEIWVYNKWVYGPEFGFCNAEHSVFVNYASCLHCYGHLAEKVLEEVQSEDVFIQKFTGIDYDISANPVDFNHNVKCGNIHWPPNTLVDYIYWEANYANNNYCEDWNIDGEESQKKSINCNNWGCNEDGYETWWFQNMPNYASNIFYEDKELPNWNQFLADFDQAVTDAVLGGYHVADHYYSFITLPPPDYIDSVTKEVDWSSATNPVNTFYHQTNTAGGMLVFAVDYVQSAWDTDSHIVSVTYNGVPLEKQAHNDYTTTPFDAVEIWTLKNPPTGNRALSITFTGAVTERVFTAISLKGTDNGAEIYSNCDGKTTYTSSYGEYTWSTNVQSRPDDIIVSSLHTYNGGTVINPVEPLQMVHRDGSTYLLGGTAIGLSDSTNFASKWESNRDRYWSLCSISIRQQ